MIYDVFISYRRVGGFDTAGHIYDRLTNDGYSVSYDIDSLREGHFDTQLLVRIEQCVDFILIVDKNCFERTLDPTTKTEDDWLRQELAYALKLKKNIIPILLAGATFPENLPEDIYDVRYYNGPSHNNEYFDSFYGKLKSFLRALPRNSVSPLLNSQEISQKTLPNLKLKADVDCVFYLDGDKCLDLEAGSIKKLPLSKGEYELRFVSKENDKDVLEMEFAMSEVDKLLKVTLSEVVNNRLQKEEERRKAEEEKRQEEERRQKEKGGKFTVNGVSFTMVFVEGGTFTMGATSEQGDDAYEYEYPTHRVTLSDYYIGETEVTQALWEAVMGSNPSYFKGDNLPVEQVSYNDVKEFILKLNQKTGKTFRLPTEAEWEYAARGGKKSKRYKYSGSDNIDDVAWYHENSGNKRLNDDTWNVYKLYNNNCRTHPVKTKQPNELGIYDMSGNVREWCSDWYGDYTSKAQTNPQGPYSGSSRVNRGGSWYYFARFCRASNRNYDFLSILNRDLGFRLALAL